MDCLLQISDGSLQKKKNLINPKSTNTIQLNSKNKEDPNKKRTESLSSRPPLTSSLPLRVTTETFILEDDDWFWLEDLGEDIAVREWTMKRERDLNAGSLGVSSWVYRERRQRWGFDLKESQVINGVWLG